MFAQARDWTESFIKDRDMFGHEIPLNFDKKGPTYNTVIGGFFSTVIKVGLFLYIAICFKRLILNEKDDTITTVGLLNLD